MSPETVVGIVDATLRRNSHNNAHSAKASAKTRIRVRNHHNPASQ